MNYYSFVNNNSLILSKFNMDKENSGTTGRHRTRSRSSNSGSSKKKRSKGDYNKITGIGLVLFGVAMCMYSFGMFDSAQDLMHMPDFTDVAALWPLIIVLAGFIFLIRDYLLNSSTKKWDS
jgi:drug/metabolite transporter (DMT)-like permease